ncbi:MAG: SdpI family protein [Phycisphaerales bacterium]|nr:SdpI family protein [Phycisphaerales bacterium]
MDTLLTVVMIVAGLILIVGAVPMALGRTRRNQWYGYRTSGSLASERVWDITNRVAGRWLIGVGAVVIATTIRLNLLAIHTGTAALITAGVLAAGALIAGARAWRVEVNLTANRAG